jgi:hypothetical protein
MIRPRGSDVPRLHSHFPAQPSSPTELLRSPTKPPSSLLGPGHSGQVVFPASRLRTDERIIGPSHSGQVMFLALQQV